MKRGFLVLVFTVVMTAGAFAQNWYNSYAPGIVDNGTRLFINTGAAIGLFPIYTKMLVPPLEASVEYALPINLPISVGGFFCFAMGKDKDAYTFSYADIDETETAMSFGVRAFYHFNFIPNLDVYAGLGLGWLVWKVKYVWTKGSQSDMALPSLWDPIDYSQFFYDFRVGAKYFFTKNIGVYAEVGYNVISIIGVGLSLKF